MIYPSMRTVGEILRGDKAGSEKRKRKVINATSEGKESKDKRRNV